MERVRRIELLTLAWKAKVIPFYDTRIVFYLSLEIGRSTRIRTLDPLLPKQVRYQTALHSDFCVCFNIMNIETHTNSFNIGFIGINQML